MRLVNAEEEKIVFADECGKEIVITSDWHHDCCENNYADFNAIVDDELAKNTFDNVIVVPPVEGQEGGFQLVICGLPHRRLGTYNKTYWVPCYSEQNGYYTTNIDIYLNGEHQFSLDCEQIL